MDIKKLLDKILTHEDFSLLQPRELGFLLSYRDGEDNTILELAVRKNREDICSFTISHFENISVEAGLAFLNHVGWYGTTALYSAVDQPSININIIKLLVNHGALNIYVTHQRKSDDLISIFALAAQSGMHDVIELLFLTLPLHQRHIFIHDAILHVLTENPNDFAVNALLDFYHFNDNVDHVTSSLLQVACERQTSLEIIQALVYRGSQQLNHQASISELSTPLHHVNIPQIVKFMLDKGALPALSQDHDGNLCYHNRDPAIARIYFEYGNCKPEYSLCKVVPSSEGFLTISELGFDLFLCPNIDLTLSIRHKTISSLAVSKFVLSSSFRQLCEYGVDLDLPVIRDKMLTLAIHPTQCSKHEDDQFHEDCLIALLERGANHELNQMHLKPYLELENKYDVLQHAINSELCSMKICLSWLKTVVTRCGVNISQIDTVDDPLIIQALKRKHCSVNDLVLLIDELGVNVNRLTYKGCSTLMFFCYSEIAMQPSSAQLLAWLLSRGAVINCQNNIGNNCLHVLMHHYFRPLRETPSIPLEVAHIPLVMLLLQAGIDPRAKDSQGKSSITLAKDRNCLRIMTLMEKHVQHLDEGSEVKGAQQLLLLYSRNQFL